MVVSGAMQAQVLTPLANFNGTNGGNPYKNMALVEGLDGNLYGVTFYGGTSADGTVFKVSGGSITALHSFSISDGFEPVGGLVLATNGKLYGTTELGGTIGGKSCGPSCGTIFRISSAGAFKSMYTFCTLGECADGEFPLAGLIQGATGSFYGTTEGGGTGCGGCGTAFKMSAAGKLKTLYNFTGQLGTGDGYVPTAPLLQASDGNFYGTTSDGGGSFCNCGTVFQMIPAGKVKVLYSFGSSGDYSQGASPYGGLVEGLDGNLYGTTTIGGSPSGGPGTIFKITKGGVLTTVHSFAGYAGDGAGPGSNLIVGSDGNIYGTTVNGGSGAAACNCGTIFRLNSDGTVTLLYSFTNKADGALPFGGIMQATDGSFYGATTVGGSNTSTLCAYDSTHTCGVVYGLSIGLAPFVKALPASGKVGKAVKILGSSLTGASAVSFNGTPAAFAVASATEIKTKVPAGATTGYITVTTPGGGLQSNVPFRVP